MKHTRKILNIPHAIVVVLLFFTIFTITIKASLASDELADDKKPQKVKYSTFFDEKKHWCDALVITCTDFRFTTATQEFINDRMGLKGKSDYISIPGSIRNLMDSKTRDLVMNSFGISLRLHHVKRVIILAHQDCTIGYGGSENLPRLADEHKN